MKMLKNSSSGLRRSLGLGLVALALSIVPAGQASAVTSMTAYDLVADAMTASGTTLSQTLVITESWDTPVQYGTYTYTRTYPIFGGGSSTYSSNNPALFDTNGNAFVVEVGYTGANAGGDVITIEKQITNNTGYDWNDFHWAFSYWNPNTRLWEQFDGASFVSMGGDMGTMVWDGYSAHWEAQNGSQVILGNGDTGTFRITGDLGQLVAVAGVDGTLRIEQVPTVLAVPEPNSAMLLGIGGLIGAVMLRRKYAVEA
jgi:hypothetical protein